MRERIAGDGKPSLTAAAVIPELAMNARRVVPEIQIGGKALERADYTVEEAPDGNAAIEKIRARRYLLVLTDLKLPGSSGLDVLREARRRNMDP